MPGTCHYLLSVNLLLCPYIEYPILSIYTNLIWSNLDGGYPSKGNCHGKDGEDEGVDHHSSLKSQLVVLMKSQI